VEVFNDVLFNESSAAFVTLALLHRVLVDVGVGQEATVAWHVLGHFVRAHGQFIDL
jgi:hypothetical protein